MKILKNLEIIDLALKYKDILIIGDLHLGLEGTFLNKGVMLPVNQLDEIIKRLEKIIKKAKPKKIIINGDLKEEFGTISTQEWRDIGELITFLREKVDLILIKGNHDTILEPIAKKFNLPLKQRYDIDEISILHGDTILKNLKKTIIISHEHPAVSFKERPDEKYKCFLIGKYKKHHLIIIPSFNPLIEGSDITKEEYLSPYIKDLSNFDIYVVQDRVYNFGKLKKIQKF
ncbi:MAG: metallophosphoesterase [Candidatus Woesearchaeota archaeon]